ncbi:MAG: hypothetical protein AAGD14_02805 [Planctomycetota bacterium]
MRALCLFLALATGCASWNVKAFGVPVQTSETPVFPENQTRSRDMTAEEKAGTLLIVGLAIAGVAAGAVNASK